MTGVQTCALPIFGANASPKAVEAKRHELGYDKPLPEQFTSFLGRLAHGDLQTSMPAKKGDVKAAVFVIHGSKDPVAPKADRDALEAEMDGAGCNWQLLDFGGRLHSFAEEETMMKGVAEYNAPAAHQTFRMLDDFIQDAFNKKL